jgi:ribosomal protein S11
MLKKINRNFFNYKNNYKIFRKKNNYEIFNLHIKKTLNNFFLTLTKTNDCNVLYQLSAGKCKIFTKKKKKSLETLKQLTVKMLEFLNFNKITYIKNFFIILNNNYYFKKTLKFLKKNKIYIEKVFLYKKKIHNGIRKQKPKRL